MPNSPVKTRRQDAIRQILARHDVASQEELAGLLQRRGFQVTQSTLSRDLRDMSVVRQLTANGYAYQLAEAGQAMAAPPRHLRQLAAGEVIALEANEAMVVIRTLSGRAQGVASFLDSWPHGDLLATVAGDDTVLALPSTTRHTGRLRQALAELFTLQPQTAGQGVSS